MNGIDKITARIEAEASAEAAQIALAAEQEAAQLRAEADKQAQDSYWNRLRRGMKGVEERSSRLASTADMEAKKNILSFKQSAVASVFEAAEARLLSMPEEDYIRFLTDKAVSAAETGREELIFNRRDREKLGSSIVQQANAVLAGAGKTAELTVSDAVGDFSGGLIVRRGSVEYNCTVEALTAQARENLSAKVASILFS